MSRGKATSSRTKHIFPFLDLPYELQSLIYRQYYEGTETTLELVNVKEDSTWQYNRELIFRGIPSSNIEFLNHQIRQDAIKFKNRYFTRTLKIDRTKTLPRIVERLISDPRYDWICQHIEDVCLSTTQTQIRWRIVWSFFLQAFPNVKRIHLERMLFGSWTTASYHEKAVREFTESAYAEKLKSVMTREFRLNPLIDALGLADREVWIGVWLQWNRRAIDTDNTFRVIMEGSIASGGLWDVTCKVINEDPDFVWDEVPSQVTTTHANSA